MSFVVYCGCGWKTEAPVHCRRCNKVDGTPNCECGRPLKVVHIHSCDSCRRSPSDTGATIVSPFDPSVWPSKPLTPIPGTTKTCSATTSTMMTNGDACRAEAPKFEAVERPKEYVESWEYGKRGELVAHEMYGFRKEKVRKEKRS